MSRLLARLIVLPLLDAANDSPPVLARREFYALKERLLRRYATPDGIDVQHIKDECYECSGREKPGCYRCVNGVYRERFVALNRWRWGKHSFHTFKERLSSPPTLPTIHGFVRHGKRLPGHWPTEAFYWLALVCGDWKAFASEFGRCWHYKPRSPLVLLGTLTCEFKCRWRRAWDRIVWAWRRDDNELPF